MGAVEKNAPGSPAGDSRLAEGVDFSIRRALVRDVDAIFALTKLMASRDLMLPRSKYKIVSVLSSFFVAVDKNEKLMGCGSCAVLWTDLAEICALAVNDEWRGKGLGRALVDTLIAEAHRMGIPKIITLTYQIEFFKKLGFIMEDKDAFPRKLWRECLECPKLEQCDETAMYKDIG
jgi:amino-acid N-acetyltransferase